LKKKDKIGIRKKKKKGKLIKGWDVKIEAKKLERIHSRLFVIGIVSYTNVF
jgi:hypothetical protein